MLAFIGMGFSPPGLKVQDLWVIMENATVSRAIGSMPSFGVRV